LTAFSSVARTISELETCADVLDHHIMEVISYRTLERPTYMGHQKLFYINSFVVYG
jgi:hypothetical protein